jgi:enterochelin esterase-like enzyme
LTRFSAVARARPLRLAAALWQRRRTLLTLLAGTGGVGLAIGAGMVFAANGVDQAISDEMVAVGFDGERGRLIAAFCLALLTAGVSGVIVLRRGVAWLGGFLSFTITFLWPFYQQAQHPLLGPRGQPLTAVGGALVHVTLTLAALGLVFAGAGAVLGEACGQLVIPPLVALVRHLLAALRLWWRPAGLSSFPGIARPLAAAVLLVGALAIGAPDLGTLLNFGTATELYQPAAALPAGEHGTVEQGTYLSLALGGVIRHFSIYLPPSYYSDDPDDEQRSYPVVYLLHGQPGGPTDWFDAAHAADTADALSAGRAASDVIIVCPDGNGLAYRVSAWANSFDNKQRMEDAIATDLVSYIDAHYRTLPDAADRVIGGLSEGGFGAANIGLHRPDVFSKVMSLDGYYQTDTSNPTFGHGPTSDGYRHYNSPYYYLQSPQGQKAARKLTFVIGLGTQDSFYKAGLSFVKELTALSIAVHVIQTDGGHNWVQWGEQFGASLPMLMPRQRQRLHGPH